MDTPTPVKEWLATISARMNPSTIAADLHDRFGLSADDIVYALSSRKDGLDLNPDEAAQAVEDGLKLSPAEIARALEDGLSLSPSEVAYILYEDLHKTSQTVVNALVEGLHLDSGDAVMALNDGAGLDPREIARILRQMGMDFPEMVNALLDAEIEAYRIHDALSAQANRFYLTEAEIAHVMLEGKILHDERFQEMTMVLDELSDMRETILKDYLPTWSEELARFRVLAKASAVEAVLRQRWDYPKTRDEQNAPAN